MARFTTMREERLEYIKEMEKVVTAILNLIEEQNPCSITALAIALEELAQECRSAVEQFGLWREDELSVEDIVDRIDAKACQILDGLTSEPGGHLRYRWQ